MRGRELRQNPCQRGSAVLFQRSGAERLPKGRRQRHIGEVLFKLRATSPPDARVDERNHELVEKAGLPDIGLAFHENELE
jgi:hypothetical protein